MYKAAKWQRGRDQVRNAAVVGKENVFSAYSSTAVPLGTPPPRYQTSLPVVFTFNN